MSLSVRWSESLADIAALESAWRALEAEAADATPMASFDYLMPWYTHYAGHAGRPLVGTAWEGATLVGLAPLLMRPGRVAGIPLRCVQFAAGGAEAGEFLRPAGRPEIAGAFLESLAGEVPFHVARFNLLDPRSAEFAGLRRAADARGLALESIPTSYARVDLRGGYEKYQEALGGKFRGNLRRRRKAAEAAGALGVAGVHFESDPAAIEDAVARMFAISDRSWKAKQGGPMADHHRGFYRDVARRFGARGALDLAILTLGGRDRAYMMGVAQEGVYFDFTLSFDDEVRPLSPGILLTQEVLRRLAARGLHTFVSHGVHDYKRQFASAIVPRRRAFVFTRRPRAALSRALRFSLEPMWVRLGLLGPAVPAAD
jgi:CelD/BcsL family acetyltransferase involved in cellulose biosynthesis